MIRPFTFVLIFLRHILLLTFHHLHGLPPQSLFFFNGGRAIEENVLKLVHPLSLNPL